MDKQSRSAIPPLPKSPFKRARSSPPPTARLVKKPHLTPPGSITPTQPARKQLVIDLDSSDDHDQGRMPGPCPAKQQPTVIDVDTSDGDSDLKVTKVTGLRKARPPTAVNRTQSRSASPSKRPIDVDSPKGSSDDEEDVMWLDGVCNQFRNPNCTPKPAATSRPSIFSIPSKETSLHGRFNAMSAADRKPGPSHVLPYVMPKDSMLSGPMPERKPPTSQLSPYQNRPVPSPRPLFDRKPPTPQVLPHPNRAGPSPHPCADFKPTLITSVPPGPTPDRKPSTSALLAYQHRAGASPRPFLPVKPTLKNSKPPSPMPDMKPSTSQLSPYKNIPGLGALDIKPTHLGGPPFDPLDPAASLALFNGVPYYNPLLQDGESHEFLKQAVQNMDFTHNATVAGAREELGLAEGDDQRLDGLAVQLMAHQIMGVAWMVKQEKSKNMGGILGDEMGLGKTIQMIATMVKNASTDSKIKATLVLAPLALLTQWKEEIADRSTCDLKVLIYHSSSKPTERTKVSGYDVVITTLDTLKRDWDDPAENTRPKKPRGLYKTEWYRVVIDEAQIIRNRNAKKSQAVCSLNSVYRWCLTGTPIFNNLWDLYPYLRFLRLRPYNDAQRFREHITHYEKNNPNLATRRAQAVLATCMLRRQKNSKLDGKPLIVLPPKHKEDVMLDLSPDEREIYEMLEKSAQQKFNVFLRKGTVLKNFACILVLLLRLRQACGHPSLAIEEDPTFQEDDASSDPEFKDPESELQRAIAERGQPWVDTTKNKCVTETQELVKAEQQDSNEAAAPECPICTDPLDDTARITKCGHVFCEACLDNLLMASRGPMEDDRLADPKTVPKPCPNCRTPFCRLETYLRKAFLPPVDELEDDDGGLPDSGVVIHHKMRNGVVGDSDDEKPSSLGIKGEDKEKIEDTVSDYFVPSTKLVWLMEQIIDVQKEHPTDKFIVVSQWTGMLAICGRYLRERGLRYVSYQGDMNTVERNEAVVSFKRKPEYSIMLMSLKCGGVGLNLTCANRVISLDLAWSPASERQAFDRAHRFGQEKDVYVKRVMINNTVEQRILQLQQKKQDITDGALGEGGGKKLKRMTVSELASLFNLNTRGERLS